MGEAKRRRATGTYLRRLHAPGNPGPITRLVMPSGAASTSLAIANDVARIAETVRVRVRGALVYASARGGLPHMLDAIDQVADDCAAEFEAAQAQAASHDAARGAELARIACRRGCAFCCYVNVDVTPLEAIRLARRAAGVAPAPAQSGRSPCALLVDGECSRYALRPIVCRSVFSLDAESCEVAYQSTEATSFMPALEWPRFLASGLITGQVAALEDLRLAGHMVPLAEALRVVSQDADAPLRWLNGADIFPRRASPQAG